MLAAPREVQAGTDGSFVLIKPGDEALDHPSTARSGLVQPLLERRETGRLDPRNDEEHQEDRAALRIVRSRYP
ncbi:hypothetical protein ASF59_13625 [Methylobacterium sp. Leaf121]|nr:hypothetical protein ASF59_13625 [Methylobacterium sp. Leaf121]